MDYPRKIIIFGLSLALNFSCFVKNSLIVAMICVFRSFLGQRDFVHQSLVVPVVSMVPVNILEPVVPVNIWESVNNFIPVDLFGTYEYFVFFVKH